METYTCFLCSIKLEQDGGSWSEFEQHSVFLKFAKDYLEIGKTEGEFCDSEPPKLCECCEKTVDSISELYLELLGLELRISWKVGELGKLLQSSKTEGTTFYDDDDEHPFRKALAMKCHQKGRVRQVFEHEGGSIPHVKKIEEEMESVEEESDYDPGTDSNVDDSQSEDDDEHSFRKALAMKCHQKGRARQVFEHERSSIPHAKKTEEEMESVDVEEDSDYGPGTERNVDDSQSEDEDEGEKNASLVKKCEHCGTLLKNKKGLWAHLQRHELKLDLERRFPCPLCPNSFFKLRQSVDIHLSSIHKEAGLKTKMFLETHAKSSQNEGKAEYSCAHCSKNYSNVASFYAHVRDTHKPFSCSYCDETLLGSHAHNTHMLESHPLECQHPCPTCNKLFSSKPRLNKHIHAAHNSRRFQCPLCSVSVKTKRYLQDHIAEVHNPTPNICPHCGKTFGSARYLERHICDVHPEFAPPPRISKRHQFHKCPCGKAFRRRFPFEKHVLECTPTTAGEILRKCKICGKPMEIKDTGKMERHLFSHMSAEEKDKSGLKKRCETCGKEFMDKKAYAAHILAHKGQQFACDQCPKTFHWKQGLTRHLVNVHGKASKRSLKDG